MLASDDANPQFTGAFNPDSALAVEFYNRPVQNMFQTSKQGRPIYEDVIYVRIQIPGNKESIHDTPARTDHKQRFPLQWQHFMNRTVGDAREIGTPLTEWPALTRSQAEEFRALKFFTVESIAKASDANIANLGMIGGMAPHILRQKAQAFLQAAAGTADTQHQAEELAKRDAEIAMLKEQMRAFGERLNAPQPAAAPVAAPAAPAPKKVLTEEHKAKLAEGRRKAFEAKKAKAAAKAAKEAQAHG